MSPKAQEWLERFHRYLTTERRLSPHTVAAYEYHLAAFVIFCDRERIEDWQGIEIGNVRRFAARSHAKGLSASSVQHRLSAVRAFMTFLVREQVIPGNPAALVQAPKWHRPLPHTLDVDQMARLLDIRGTEPDVVRDRAIMELLYSSGLRVSELVQLDTCNLDLPDCTVGVLGKGNVARVLPVGSYAVRELRSWLAVRRSVAKHDEPALFVGRHGRRLTTRAVQQRVGQWARKQGISVHVHPHMFRHSFATHLLESCKDIRAVQELLGHASISTTQIYTHLDFSHLAKVYDATHPRAHRKDVTDGPKPVLRNQCGGDRQALRRPREDSPALEAGRPTPTADRPHDPGG